MPTYKIGTVYEIELVDVHENPDQPRKSYDREELENLKASIASKGIIQPILVTLRDNKVLIVDGHRRLQACKELKLKNIPSLFIEADDEEVLLITNIQRDELHPIDEAEAVFNIQHNHNYNQEQLASIIGKKQNTVSEILKINKIPKEIRDECRTDKRWSRKLLLSIARKRTPDGKKEEYEKLLERMGDKKRTRAKSNDPRLILQKCSLLHTSLAQFEEYDEDQIQSQFTPELKKEVEAILNETQTKIKEFKKRLKIS